MSKPITITIEPPVTEYCAECDYEAFNSFYSHRVICPKCRSKSVRAGERPSERPCRVIKITGNYNILRPQERQIQYIFHDVPGIGTKGGFTVDEEHDLDCDDPLSVAVELLDIYKRYIYTSDLPRIKQVVEALENDLERQDWLVERQAFRKAKRDLYQIIDRSPELLQELDDSKQRGEI